MNRLTLVGKPPYHEMRSDKLYWMSSSWKREGDLQMIGMQTVGSWSGMSANDTVSPEGEEGVSYRPYCIRWGFT